jgi:hypothetical protein
MVNRADVRHLLPEVAAPTLVLHRADNLGCSVQHGRYPAEHITGAQYVELPGQDDPWWVGDVDALLDQVEQFISSPHR